MTRHEIKDPELDWTDLDTKQDDRIGGNTNSDIISVDYYSDGKSIVATLWTSHVIYDKPRGVEELSYVMLIDADNNVRTGVRGVDFAVEISWNGKSWTKTFTEISSNGDSRIIDRNENFNNFMVNGERFIIMNADLTVMGSPDAYRIAFYTYEKSVMVSGHKQLIDFTNWINVPNPDFSIHTQAVAPDVIAGDTQRIELVVEATKDTKPEIHLTAIPPERTFNVTFENNTLKVPSIGFLSTYLTISIPRNMTIGQHTFLIKSIANFEFDDIEKDILNKTKVTHIRDSVVDIPALSISNTEKVFLFTISVKKGLSEFEQLVEFFKQGSTIVGLAIAVSSLGATIYKINSWKKNRKTKT